MGFFDNYRRRRLELTGGESAETLEHMERFFGNGENWTQDMYSNPNGARCLVGAANHVRVSPVDDAKHWLRQAIAEVMPGAARIEDFNDTHTYDEVMAVIARARQLALAAQQRALLALSAPAPVVEVLPRAPVAEVLPPRQEPARVRTFPTTRPSLIGWILD